MKTVQGFEKFVTPSPQYARNLIHELGFKFGTPLLADLDRIRVSNKNFTAPG
jgi:hypothetical protein